MRGLQLARHDATERRQNAARRQSEEPKPGFGRHGNRQPLVGADDKEMKAGRGWKRTGRSGAAFTVLLLLSNPGCYASAPIEQYNAPDNDHGSDTESDSDQFQDAGLATCAGEVDADKEEFLPDGENVRLTAAGHKMWITSMDLENGSVKAKITDYLWNQIGDEIEFSEDAPSVTLQLDGETFDLIFCGIVEDPGGHAAQFRTTRPKGFVYCLDVDCGGDFGPFEHVVDTSSTATNIGHIESDGEVADNDYEEDCAGVVRMVITQELSFAAPLPTQNNLSAEDEKTVVLRNFDGDILGGVEMDVLEVDGEEGSMKLGVSLASGSIAEGETLLAEDLEIEAEEAGDADLPEFSYAWLPDPYATIWESTGSNANEKEVNVQADSGYYPFVIRYTALQEDGSAHVHVFKKQDVQILKNDEQARIGSQVYTAQITIGDTQTIVAVSLDAVE
ncbi:MAG: hypothetical protein PHF60_05265 [Candidatus ainarchaeum sp.]|nr:hypothetical protein [Candidatus ainarchaeum sp.]